MVTSSDLAPFWELLETSFPLAGPKKHLAERLGSDLAALLEKGGILSYVGQADTYPCPQPGGPACPRQVVHHSDGRITAVCGNDPPECEDVELTATDIEILGVSPTRLCEALRDLLSLGGKAETVSDLNRVFQVGVRLSGPATRQAVYFAARCSADDYGLLLDILRSRHGAEAFHLLIPTDHFISEETIRAAAERSVGVVPLAELVNMDGSGALVIDIDPADVFTLRPSAPDVTACVFERKGQKWRVVFDGKESYVDHSNGVLYIAELLRQPDVALSAADLRDAISGRPKHWTSPGMKASDEEALLSYRRRFEDILEGLEEAKRNNDAGRAEKLEEQKARLADEVKKTQGLGGKSRKLGDDVKRARTTISNAIGRAFANIEKAHPALGAHFRACVRLGSRPIYQPGRAMIWTVST